MSSEQSSVNAETVEQTKQQIRGLVSEIAQLSKTDLSPDDYYAAFMQRIVSALAAVGGAVWLLGEGRHPDLTYQINLSDTLLDAESDDATRHLRLLEHVVKSGEPQLVPPLAGPGDEEAGGNPTRYLLVLAPLVSEGRIEGVVEIFQRPNSQPATQRGYLRFLLQMCELAGEWIKSQKLKHYSDRHSLWAQADQFARLVHECLDVRETSFTIVNEGRRMIGCDRVSVAVKRGQACKIEAVSGQDTLENRSNIVNGLSKLATRVVATGEPLWYDGSTEDLPPQIEEAIDHYVDESYSKSITVLPLRQPDSPGQASRETRAGEVAAESNLDREVIGALIVEQIETDLPYEIINPRIDLVYEHATRALSNSIRHNSVFLMPLWRTIGKSEVLVRARNLPKTLTVAGILLFILVGLFVFRKDFNLESRGALQPVKRTDVFFGINGTIQEVLVKDGDPVKKDQVLIKLTNYELEERWQRTFGELEQTKKALESLREQLPSANDADASRIAGEILRLRLREQSLTLQLGLIDQEKQRLLVRSPIDGNVMLEWNAKQSLLHRPVLAQQVVMSIADPTGPWELELHMPERRIGHVRNGQKKLDKDDLDVSFILATDPGQRYYGRVKEISSLTQVRGEEGPTVKILVEMDKGDLTADPRPGATVIADVTCGRSSVGYAWFHEAIEWVQKHILF